MRRGRHVALSAAPLLALAACTAIAGLDGELELASDAGVAAAETGSTTSSSSSSSGSGSAGPDGALPDTGPADGRPPDTAAPDSGPPSDAAGSYPASTDQTDASGARDASLDQRDPSYCVPNPAVGDNLCWGFTGSETSSAPWDSPALWTKTIDSGTVDVEGSGGSKERRMVASATVPPAGGTGSMLYEMPRSTSGTYIANFSVNVRLAQTYAVVAAIRIPGTKAEYGLAVHPERWFGQDALGENEVATRASDSGRFVPFDPKKWYRVRIVVTRRNNGWDGHIFVGDKLVSQRTGDALTGSLPITGGLDIVLGAFTTTATTAGTTAAAFDDFLTETPP